MKQITRLIILFILTVLHFGSIAQNYLQVENLSGLSYYQSEIDELETLCDTTLSVMPDSISDNFKIYSHHFYLHNKSFNTDILDQWENIINSIEDRTDSEYYLIIGKEISNNEICKRIRIKLKLPYNEQFDCLDEEKRSNIERYLQSSANEILIESTSFDAELSTINLFSSFITRIINCDCANIRTSCDLTPNFQLLNAELLGLGFRKKHIEIGDSCIYLNGENNIYDYFQRKIVLDGETICLTEQISFGKTHIENDSQQLPDTIINVDIEGKVFILNASCFYNGIWSDAKSASDTFDYVEYWVILFNNLDQKYYLYSKYTIGHLEPPDPANDPLFAIRSRSPTISPFGLVLKALGNAAVDALAQAVIIRFIDPEVKSWGEAWEEVSVWGALWEGGSSLIPWKKTLATQILKHLASAFAVVLDKAIHEPEYTIDNAATDFMVGCGASVLASLSNHPKVVNAGKYAFRKGMGRFYREFTEFQTGLKDLFNSALELVGGGKSGSIISPLNKVDLPENSYFQVDDVVESAKKELVAFGEFTDEGAKFWRQHEMNVTEHLIGNSNYVRVGRQLTFEVIMNNGQSFKVVFDNLGQDAINKFTIIDGKSSILKDLSVFEPFAIKNKLCTENQKMLYDGLISGNIRSIYPKGERALAFIDPPRNIVDDVLSEIHFYVSDYPHQGYGIFQKIYRLMP